jgi:hypothetical protein
LWLAIIYGSGMFCFEGSEAIHGMIKRLIKIDKVDPIPIGVQVLLSPTNSKGVSNGQFSILLSDDSPDIISALVRA